jgi:hypothetical protein
MAAVTFLGGTFNTTAGSKTFTGTPAVGDLIVIVTAHTGNTADTAPNDDNADGLGTYTEVESRVKNSSADKAKMWIRNALIGSATSTIFTHAPGTTTGGGIVVLKVTGMSRSGSSAKLKSGGQDNQAAATPAPSWTGGGSGLSANPKVGAVFNATNPATMTRPASFDAERLDGGYATPTTGLEVVSDDSGNTDSTVTWGSASASAFASLILELDASPIEKNVSDTISVGVTDASANLLLSDVSDALSLSVTEVPEVSAVIDVVDSLALAVSETSSNLLLSDVTDSLLVALTDTSAVTVTVEVSDSLLGGLSEAMATSVFLDVLDALSVSLSETQSGLLLTTTSDTLSVVVTDTSIVVPSVGAVGEVVVSDVLSTTSLVSNQLSTSVVVRDIASGTVTISDTDSGTLIVSDARVGRVEVTDSA